LHNVAPLTASASGGRTACDKSGVDQGGGIHTCRPSRTCHIRGWQALPSRASAMVT